MSGAQTQVVTSTDTAEGLTPVEHDLQAVTATATTTGASSRQRRSGR